MSTTDQDVLTYLKSIDISLKHLVKASRVQGAKPVADNTMLDGQYGDPVVKSMPKFWTGDDYKGQRFSVCPPELLDMIAELQDWVADRSEEKNERTDDGKPIAAFRRRDAAKARGWAKRKREGWVAPKGPAWSETKEAPINTSEPSEPLPDWAGPQDW
jgi:hypothetical protein